MKLKIILIVGLVVLLAAVAGATWWFTKGSAPPASANVTAEVVKPKQPVYFSIEPAFVVNLKDNRSLRFLQIQVDVMSRDEEVIAQVEQYLPRIRNDLIMLFAKLERSSVETEEARLKIQQDALAAINAVLKAEAGSKGIEAVYFSKFVMQ